MKPSPFPRVHRQRLRGRPAARRGAAAALGLTAVAAASLLSACDASPFAASVGGHSISSAALNNELRWAQQAKDYSAIVSANFGQLTGTNLKLTGATPNSYSAGWTAFTLTQMIQGQVVRRAVAAQGTAPDSNLYAAAMGGVEIESGGVTGPNRDGGVTQMAPGYLITLTQRVADHAFLETPLPTSQLQGYYANYRSNFYTQVCVRQASVTVTGASGGIDFAASKTRAEQVARQMSTAPNSVGGAYNCYSHEQVNAQSATFINTVVALAPGQASIAQTPFGYQVTGVASRDTLPLAGPVAKVLTTLVYDLRGPGSDTVLQRLLSQARVKVNPAFGTWHAGDKTTLAGIRAPRVPATAPVGGGNSGLSLGSVNKLVGP